MKKRLIPLFAVMSLFGLLIWNIPCQEPRKVNTQNSIIPINTQVIHDVIYLPSNAELDSFCAGNGTSGNITHPHIIQDYNFADLPQSIVLSNISLHLIIRNCTFSNSELCICLNQISNITITECTFSGGFRAIEMENSSKFTFYKNQMMDCLYYLKDVHNFNISNNLISYNFSRQFDQLRIELCENGTISDNIIRGRATYNGVYINIMRNSFESGSIDIWVNYSQISDNYMVRDDYTWVYAFVNGGSYNTFFGNIFIQSQTCSDRVVIDLGSHNAWDDGSRGNYYSDYYFWYNSSTHTNTTWKTPYLIEGTAMSYDRYPLVNVSRFPAQPVMIPITQKIVDPSVQLNWTAIEEIKYYRLFINGSLNQTCLCNGTLFYTVGIYALYHHSTFENVLHNGVYLFTVQAVNGWGYSPISISITVFVEIPESSNINGFSLDLCIGSLFGIGIALYLRKRRGINYE